MGGAVSAGEDNDDLVDNLVRANYIRSGKVTDVFRTVDRGHYYLKGQRNSAYYDIAWKFDHLHLSAPCIYSEVMEQLDLQPGMSFLNLGSGTGYLSTMAGLLLGPNGINHGLEIHGDVVEYAKEHLEEFVKKCPSFDRFEFCYPQFEVGNCLLLPPDTPGYDRIYCGAACPTEYANYLKSLLNIEGKLVLPLEDQLQVITRTSENDWDSKSALAVSFAQLVIPDSKDANNKSVAAPPRNALCLKELCRFSIRRAVRSVLKVDAPPKRKKRKRSRHRSSSGIVGEFNPRQAVFHLRRRRINTDTDFGSRRRRRVNTSGDSDHYSSSDSELDDDNDEQSNTDRTKSAESIPKKEMKESSSQTDLANDTNDITLSDPDNENEEAGTTVSDNHEKDNQQDSNAKGEPSARTTAAPYGWNAVRGNASVTVGNAQSGESSRTRCAGVHIGLVTQSRSNAGSGRSTSEGNRQLVRVSRPARLAYALMRSIRRPPPTQQSSEEAAGESEPTDSVQSSESEDEDDDPEEPEEIFPPLTETPYTAAIRRLPFPPSLINYLLYYRQ